MAYFDIGLRHIVDVNSQLLAIDNEVIATSSLLAKAGLPADAPLWLIRAGESFPLQPNQLLHLSQDEVLFFVTAKTGHHISPQLLAA